MEKHHIGDDLGLECLAQGLAYLVSTVARETYLCWAGSKTVEDTCAHETPISCSSRTPNGTAKADEC